MATTSTQTVYYENYVEVDVQLQVAGQNIDVPEHDFMLRFYTKGGSSHFDCMRRDGKFVNCSPSADGTTIECHLSEHGLMPGQLLVKYYDFSPNVNFLRGQKLVIEPAMQVPVMLTTAQSDTTTKVSVDVAADIITIISDAKVLIDKLKNAKYIESFEVSDTDTPGEHNTLTVRCSDGMDVVLRSRNGLDGEDAVIYSLTLSSAVYKSNTTNIHVGVAKHSGGSVEQLTELPKGWRIKVHWEGAELAKDGTMGIGTLNPNEIAGATSVELTLYDGDPTVAVDGKRTQAIDSTTLLLVADGKDGKDGEDLYTKIGAADADKLSQPNAHFMVVEEVPITDTVKLGSGSIVSFLQGKGKFTGSGTIDLNGAVVDALQEQDIFSTSLSFARLWGNQEIYPEWWGAKGDGTTDDSLAINTAIKYAGHTKVKLCKEQYLVKSTITAVEPDSVADINSAYDYTNGNGVDYNVRKQIEIMHDIIGDASLEGAVIRIGTVSNELIVHGAVVVRNNSDKAIGVSMLGGSETAYGVNDFNVDGGKLYIDSIIHGHDSFPAPYIDYADADVATYGIGKGTGIILSGIKSDVVINSISGFEKGAWLSYVQSSTIQITQMSNIYDVYIGALTNQKYGKSVTRSDIRIGYHSLNKNWSWVKNTDKEISIFVNDGTLEVALNRFRIGSNNNTESYVFHHVYYTPGDTDKCTGNTFDCDLTMVYPYGDKWMPICCNQTKILKECGGNTFRNTVAWGYKHIKIPYAYNTLVTPVIVYGDTYSSIFRYGNTNPDKGILCDMVVTSANAPSITANDTTESIKVLKPKELMSSKIVLVDGIDTSDTASYEKGKLYVVKGTTPLLDCYAFENNAFAQVGKIEQTDVTAILVADRKGGEEVLYDECFYPNKAATTDTSRYTDSTEILQPTGYVGDYTDADGTQWTGVFTCESFPDWFDVVQGFCYPYGNGVSVGIPFVKHTWTVTDGKLVWNFGSNRFDATVPYFDIIEMKGLKKIDDTHFTVYNGKGGTVVWNTYDNAKIDCSKFAFGNPALNTLYDVTGCKKIRVRVMGHIDTPSMYDSLVPWSSPFSSQGYLHRQTLYADSYAEYEIGDSSYAVTRHGSTSYYRTSYTQSPQLLSGEFTVNVGTSNYKKLAFTLYKAGEKTYFCLNAENNPAVKIAMGTKIIITKLE